MLINMHYFAGQTSLYTRTLYMKLTRTMAMPQPKTLPHFFSPTLSCCVKPSFHLREKKPLKHFEFHTKRRLVAISWALLLAKEALFAKPANGFDLQLVAPDQTIEEAENGIKGHAEALLQVKDLIEFESWRDVQVALRKSASFLKQDIYTIIQGKPPSERPQLRKLYSDLFNNVTKLDYAVRDRKDASYIQKYYENIVVVLNQILSRI